MTTITPSPTQVRRPWRATARSIFQALIAFSATWGLIVEVLELDTTWVWVSVSLAVTGGITRVMAIPQVEAFLARFLPFLAADPNLAKVRVHVDREATSFTYREWQGEGQPKYEVGPIEDAVERGARKGIDRDQGGHVDLAVVLLVGILVVLVLVLAGFFGPR